MSAVYIAPAGGAPACLIADGTLAAAVQVAYDIDFRQRLYVMVPLFCVLIYREDPATTNHAARLRLAQLAEADPEGFVNHKLSFMMAADGVTNVGSTDQALANRMGDLWDPLSAGY